MSKKEPNPTLKSVRLRDVVADDLPVLFQHQLDPDGIRLAVVNPRNAEAFNAHWQKILGDRSAIAKAITLDGLVVGYVSTFRAQGQNEVGYWLAKEHWGKGIATRALALLLEQVAIRPLHATVASTNVASIRVLQRCGFMITGCHMAPADDRYPACEVAMLVLT